MCIKNLNIIKIVLIFVIVFCHNGAWAGEPSERMERVEEHINVLKTGPIESKLYTTKVISDFIYTDQRLFDVVQSELLQQYLTAEDSDIVDYMCGLCKALAVSGQAKYKPTLEKVFATSEDSKIKRYAEGSLELFESYSLKTEVLLDPKNIKEGRSSEVVSLMNMLQSENLMYKREAARIISKGNCMDRDLYKQVNKELRAGFKDASGKLPVDTMAWLCRALSVCPHPDSKKRWSRTLKKVMRNASSNKLSIYAQKSLKRINGS